MSSASPDLASSLVVLDEVPETPLSAQDSAFLQQAQQANLAEIETARLALDKTPDDATREFARWMLGDHGANSAVLTSIADRLGISLPTTVDPAHQAEITALAGLEGREFDQSYATTGVADHADAVALFQNEIQDGENPAVVSFAEQTLPLLQAHFEQAAILAGEPVSGLVTSAPETNLAPAADSTTDLSDQDRAFVAQATEANLSEIAEGQQAIEQSDDPAIDEYGRWMIADHSAMNAALSNITGQPVTGDPRLIGQFDEQVIRSMKCLVILGPCCTSLQKRKTGTIRRW